MSEYYSGKFGAVKIGDDAIQMDEWSLILRAPAVDVSDESSRSARYLPGVRSAEIMFSGPYDFLDLQVGQEYLVALILDEDFEEEDGPWFPPFTVLVRDINLKHSARGVARVSVSASVNADIDGAGEEEDEDDPVKV